MTFQNRHFFKPSELSENLLISKTIVYRMINAGEIKSVRIRKQLRIPKEEYCRYCQGTGGCQPCGRPGGQK